MTQRLTIGVDFGTESCRAVVLDLDTGAELGVASQDYPGGVMDTTFPPTGQRLPVGWALQDPVDYLHCLQGVVRRALEGLPADAVVGLGIDTTACTLIPTTAAGTPLRDVPELARSPHAYAKLWKHHGAQAQADRINALAESHGGLFLDAYGGKISSEWLMPKALELLEAAPEVFAAADRLMEAEDWIVSRLVGQEVRGAHVAGYKATYRAEADGYPTDSFLEELAPGFSAVLDKVGHELLAPGQRAGGLTPEWAQQLGLAAGTPVAVGNMDAHVAVLGCGVSAPGEMVLVMGTSVCNLVLGEELRHVAGMSGAVRDGIIPGYWAYEAGQPGVGDTFGWFVRHYLPADYAEAAQEAGRSGFAHLEHLAAALAPGESGLVALDWFNGNRSTLVDADLSGLLVGMTLATRAEHVYRALIEAAAFGQRTIIDTFTAAGVAVDRIVACGGLPGRSPLLMQVLADVTGREIQVTASPNTPARGAALHAALAAGADGGGLGGFDDAARLATPVSTTYRPDPAVRATYDRLYAIYTRLYEQFGHHPTEVMHALRRIARDDHAGDAGR